MADQRRRAHPSVEGHRSGLQSGRHRPVLALRSQPDRSPPPRARRRPEARDRVLSGDPAGTAMARRLAGVPGRADGSDHAELRSCPRASFERWVADRYDVVWFSTAATYSWMGRPRLGPTIVDLMDLEDVKAGQRAQLLRGRRAGRSWSAMARDLGASLEAQLNARDWRAFQKSVASSVERVILCSDVDVKRSGITNAAVVPNTFARPEQSVGRGRIGSPPVILLQGSLHYGPNMDAVDWLADHVAPTALGAPPRRADPAGGNQEPRGGAPSPAAGDHRDRTCPRYGARARPCRHRHRAAPDRERDPAEDPRVLRPPHSGRIHHGWGGRTRRP